MKSNYMDINYKIIFHSEWHCGSGQSAGFGVDLTVIRDRHGLPFIPGKTLKGLFRDAAVNLKELDTRNKNGWHDFINAVFGTGGDEGGGCATDCFFTNAALELPVDIYNQLAKNEELKRFLFRAISATAINDKGVASEHSLRVTETVIPLTVEATIHKFPDSIANRVKIKQCVQWIKRMGLHRNRGLGRCTLQIVELAGGESA